ncbi:MAG TPA: hypothetical protein VFG78_12695, partial [Gemmatimonadota bacterium]|nr:hypothetical protein [Gemmatimonadota bacterium]
MRPRTLPFLALPLLLPLSTGVSRAQTTDVPPGYTVYQILGPGVNAPPLPFKIEGDRLVAPEGGMVTVTGGRVTEDRIDVTMEVPGATVRFLGTRDGDAFTGYSFLVSEDDRDMIPLSMTPVGQETDFTPDPGILATAPGISRVEVVPGGVTLQAGEPRRFVVRAFDESGAEIADPDVEWYAAGGRTRMTVDGEFTGFEAGESQIAALVSGAAMGVTTVNVNEPEIASLSVQTEVPSRLAVGSRVTLELHALNSVHRWELDPEVTVESSAPEVVSVDGRTLVATAPGRADVTLSAGQAEERYAIEVVEAGGDFRVTGLPVDPVRTGDLVTLSTSIADARPVWSVGSPGAEIHPPSDFVAEQPGTYPILATLGDRVARATITVLPRDVRGRFHVVGRGLNAGLFTADIWPQNDYVYLGTHQANQIRTYDVSDPANPVLTDSVTVDARVINSVKVSRNGKWLAATREGAADRRNGIVLYSLEDPAHPRPISEYTETVTSGVHNVFWATDSILYLTNDGTGDMNILDVSDPHLPKEIGRWGLPVEGKSLHDIWVQDGFVWMSYMMDGLVILDIGGGGKGGTPAEPVLLSRLFYPDGPTHNAFRWGDYLFLGDEDFASSQGTKPALPAGMSADPRGEVHVIDVRDPEHPIYAARYEVPEAGAHNLWVEDGVMYVGFYQGGLRAVDVTG